MKSMTTAELKNFITDLSDNMPVIIPVIDEKNCNRIFGFRLFFRTSGLLSDENEEYQTVLCSNAANDQDITDRSV